MTASQIGARPTPWSWWLVVALTFAIAGYALSYLPRGEGAFPPQLSEFFVARPWGIYSHVLFGAVTLRIWLPLLIIAHDGDFGPAYAIVSWVSWVPNILWAEWYVRHARGTAAALVPRHSKSH